MTGKPAVSMAGRTAIEEARAVRTVSVMSYNIAHGQGMDGKVDLERIAGVIRSSGADIIALQEVDSHYSGRSGYEDQAARLASMLDMSYSYGPNLVEPPLIPGQPARKYGNAVLSRFPIKYAVNHSYREVEKPPEDAEPRGVLETVIDLGGTYLILFNTHLALHEEGLRSNVCELMDIAEATLFPAVIAGDFNAVPDNPQIERVRSKFQDAFAGAGPKESLTFPSRSSDTCAFGMKEPAARIDYLFARGVEEIRNARVIDSSASDHMPIMAELVMPSAVGPTRREAFISN
ncbi:MULTISPECIES: endonuclease/exonuclease/phosphatase family protein [Bhargavaea]|uniref:Endonuclease/exonuclease/phosphatase family protein n=1 Tax=Bhargavaea changchunensis TaxID=2134037 RepID=A0ABW2NBF8_9BACL|nr:endonuclease/exonuclease/phosphatase family protein [Bhargavaea sp. CC-171006]